MVRDVLGAAAQEELSDAPLVVGGHDKCYGIQLVGLLDLLGGAQGWKEAGIRE